MALHVQIVLREETTMPSHRKKPHSAIPAVQNYDRKRKTPKVGEPAKNDQELNKKRPGDHSKVENPTQGWTTPDPKGGNL